MFVQGDPDRHSSYFFIPHFLKRLPGDHAAVVASCLPPRPLLLVAPMQDVDMVSPSSQLKGKFLRDARFRPRCCCLPTTLCMIVLTILYWDWIAVSWTCCVKVPEGVDALVARVEPAYAAADASEAFVVHRPHHEHEFTPAIFERLASWLSQVLVTSSARDRRPLTAPLGGAQGEGPEAGADVQSARHRL